jgi:hypothetical protein
VDCGGAGGGRSGAACRVAAAAKILSKPFCEVFELSYSFQVENVSQKLAA